MQTKIYFSGGGILGCLGRPTPPPGGRAGSENDTLLPMTMICDRLKFWSGPAWRSKVIIRKPWRRRNRVLCKCRHTYMFLSRQMCIIVIIIYMYLNKIAILHHWMQSFHIIVYYTPVYCTLVYCTIADRSDRFATLISLREHANERYADRFDC